MDDQAIKKKILAAFHKQFEDSYQTILVDEGHEPVYLPSDDSGKPHRIVFAHGFWNSALHEIAHWCIAGPQRRTQEDYGYWYQPDGRSREKQSEFESVEVRPQALEWHFTCAIKKDFFLSVDNLDGAGGADLEAFKKAVQKEALSLVRQGLPKRARMFWLALQEEFRSHNHVQSYWTTAERDNTLPF